MMVVTSDEEITEKRKNYYFKASEILEVVCGTLIPLQLAQLECLLWGCYRFQEALQQMVFVD